MPQARRAISVVCHLDPYRVMESRSRLPVLRSNAMEIHALVDRVKAEFNEMPGLRLTVPQATRLWGLERAQCVSVVDALIRSSFLRWGHGGTIVRAVQ
jgi:hypothetical protein